MEPSRYEKDILKQLTRIANALENINNKTENMNKEMHVSPDGTLTVKPAKDNSNYISSDEFDMSEYNYDPWANGPS